MAKSRGGRQGNRKRGSGARGGAARGAKGSGSTARAAAGTSDGSGFSVEDLPKVDALQDVPGFDDLRYDEEQLAAFEGYQAELAAADDPAAEQVHLGCVIRLDRGFPLIATKEATFRAEHSVAFARDSSVLPAVGDWVAVRIAPGHDMGVIERVLPRRTVFERWRGRNRGERQVLAANVDVIFTVQPLGAERDTPELIRDRIARSLVLINDCGAEPVVVLTKVDRVSEDELAATMDDVRRLVGSDVRVIPTSSAEGSGLDEVRACVPKGTVGMILGESGAGKSTLLNALLGHELLATNDVRERDDAGRHTTVARVMVRLPEPCGVICDAPGLRSLPLMGHDRGLARTFPDIVEASRRCRFNDCTHTHEPGCGVREAVEDGEIEEVRVEAFLALSQEMRVSAQSLDPDVHV